jgi:hypothetical protein
LGTISLAGGAVQFFLSGTDEGLALLVFHVPGLFVEQHQI